MKAIPKLATTSALAVIVLCVLCGVASAAPPGNDAFAAATSIQSGAEVNSTNLEATSEGVGEPNSAGSSTSPQCSDIEDAANCGTSVWYRFVAPTGGEYTVETCDGGTDVDTTLGVYTGTLASLNEIDSNDDGGSCAGGYDNNGSSLSFTATNGVAYLIDVGGYEADEGSFYLRIYPGADVARPDPDTSIDRENSYQDAASDEGSGRGTLSGPRQTPSFLLRSDQIGATFECSLDGAAYSACGPAVSIDQELAAGPHTFAARAASAGAVDPTPVIERFAIDKTPPATSLLAGPAGGVTPNPVKWIAASSERYNLDGQFICGIDSQPSETCNTQSSFTELCTGSHEFRISAFDKAFNVDPAGIKAAVQVTGGPEPCAFPGLGTPIAAAQETEALIQGSNAPRGAGGYLRLEYGPTTAYGTTTVTSVPPKLSGTYTIGVRYLQPATTYHYNLTMVTPFGENSSSDQTFTTTSATEDLPSAVNGEPKVAGAHAAELPFTVDTHGQRIRGNVLIEAGAAVGLQSPRLSHELEIPLGATAPVSDAIAVSDLQPNTTYHYRLAMEQPNANQLTALGPEGAFTTGPFVKVSSKAHFNLRKRNVKIGKLKRSSKKLRISVKGVPARTQLNVKLKVGKAKQTATKKANAKGKAKFKVTLSKRIRKALQKRKTKRATITVIARPPGDTASKIVFKPKLKP